MMSSFFLFSCKYFNRFLCFKRNIFCQKLQESVCLIVELMFKIPLSKYWVVLTTPLDFCVDLKG